MKKPTVRNIDYRALADFRYEICRFLNFSERAARAAGIEPRQHQALLAIKGLPRESKATVGTLAERLRIEHHSAVELTNRLARKGWMRRSRGRTDHREVLLHLTPRGENLLARLSLSHRDELRTAAPRLIASLQTAAAHRRWPRRGSR